jgi:hypothetical protein
MCPLSQGAIPQLFVEVVEEARPTTTAVEVSLAGSGLLSTQLSVRRAHAQMTSSSAGAEAHYRSATATIGWAGPYSSGGTLTPDFLCA